MSLTQGSVGRPVHVTTNSFAITSLPTKIFYHYDVVVTKTGGPNSETREIPNTRRTAELIDKMQDQNSRAFPSRASYDGVKNLFTTKKLNDGQYNVEMGGTRGSAKYIIRLSLVGQINPADVANLTSSRGADTLGPPSNANTFAMTLLQVILSQAPQQQYEFPLKSKSFYIRAGFRPLSGGLEGMKGFFQSVRATAGKIIVNVDTTAAAFYKAIGLMDAALEVLGARDVRELNRSCASPEQFQKLRSFLKGVLVVVKPGDRVKRVLSLVKQAGREEFDKDGQRISVAEYWAQYHNRPLNFADSFGVRTKSGAIFPAEACTIKPGQRYTKRLSPEDTTAFMQLSVSKPDARLAAIQDAVRNNLFKYSNSPFMLEAGMAVDSRPLTVTGRELPTPSVLYNDNSTLNVRGGSWNLVGQRLRQPARIRAWAVAVFDSSRGIEQRVQAFVGALQQQMGNLGMIIDQRPAGLDQPQNPQNVAGALNAVGKACVEGLPRLPDGTRMKPSFILVILPPGGDDLRKEVKYWGDVQMGIPTQCVKAGKYDKDKGRDQYCGNLALKINMKVGGVNSYVQPRDPSLINLMKDSIIVGCDVTHPSPGVTSRPSVASLVASMEPGATRYKVHLDVQPPRQEIITNMVPMLDAALQSYFRRMGRLPRTVIIYRDGVSEGEYAKVNDEEIRRVEEYLANGDPFKNMPPQQRPQLVFIVVGKRHHIRFFPQQGQADRSGNCNAGLVVDSGIVHSKLMDFYLQSHSGIIGTSRPSHYVVLRNGPQWSADQLQGLSYALCFVYGAATRSVSIPAPVYYADKVCTRAALQFNPSLHFQDEEGSGEVPFDLDMWKRGLTQSPLASEMYFV